jgi:hypothetical protein
MKLTARLVLLLGAALLLLYPLWGLISPTSFETELAAHYAFAEGVSAGQVRASAAMLWISNGLMSFAFFSLARYISYPGEALYGKLAGWSITLYPMARTLVEVLSGINLTSHANDVEVAIVISSDKMFFIVFGLGLLGAATAWAEHNKPGSGAKSTSAP